MSSAAFFLSPSPSGHGSVGGNIFERVRSEFCGFVYSPSLSSSSSVSPGKPLLSVTCSVQDRSRIEDKSSRFSLIPKQLNFSVISAHAFPVSAVQSLFTPSLWTWTYRRSEDDKFEEEECERLKEESLAVIQKQIGPVSSIRSGVIASSIFTSLLVTYSVLISDWWKFKHTARDRFEEAMLGHPLGRNIHRVSSPVASRVSQILQPTLKIQVLGRFLGRGRQSDDSPSIGGNQILTPDGVIWEQRDRDVEAEKRRGLLTSQGFSFSAAGLLFPYHLGVTQCLIENGLMKDNTPLAGSSAGSIVCAVIASGLGMQQALDATKDLAKDCRANGTAFRLGAVLRNFLEEFLPVDAHERSSGRIRVAVTQVFSSPRGLLVDSFDSRQDLINSLVTSSFVPGYLAPSPFTRYRDRICIDGGLSNFMPPTAGAQTVRVCVFPGSSFGLGGIEISPDLNPSQAASMKQLFSWALQPADDHILDDLFEKGYNDCSVWVQKNRTSSQGLIL